MLCKIIERKAVCCVCQDIAEAWWTGREETEEERITTAEWRMKPHDNAISERCDGSGTVPQFLVKS